MWKWNHGQMGLGEATNLIKVKHFENISSLKTILFFQSNVIQNSMSSHVLFFLIHELIFQNKYLTLEYLF